MTCGCGSIHNLDCPVAESMRRVMDEAAGRAWARELRDVSAIREARREAEARQRPWGIHWVRGEGAYLFHCRQGVEVDVLNGGPARCETCGKEDSLEKAHASAVPLVKYPWNASCPCSPDRCCPECSAPRPPSRTADARQDMKVLLLRMRQLVGEMDRLLEKSK